MGHAAGIADFICLPRTHRPNGAPAAVNQEASGACERPGLMLDFWGLTGRLHAPLAKFFGIAKMNFKTTIFLAVLTVIGGVLWLIVPWNRRATSANDSLAILENELKPEQLERLEITA